MSKKEDLEEGKDGKRGRKEGRKKGGRKEGGNMSEEESFYVGGRERSE